MRLRAGSRVGGRRANVCVAGLVMLLVAPAVRAACLSPTTDPTTAALFSSPVLSAEERHWRVEASIQAPAFQSVTFRYNGSACQVACTESGCSPIGEGPNNHLSASVTGGVDVTEALKYVTSVPTDFLGACGFTKVAVAGSPSTQVSLEATLCAEVSFKECEALDLSNSATACTKVRLSLPRSVTSTLPSQAVGPWVVDKVTAVTDGSAASDKAGWPTAVTVSVLSSSGLTVDAVELLSVIEDQSPPYATFAPIKSLGTPAGCSAYTTNGQCKQTFSFAVFVGAGSEACDDRESFEVTVSGRCQPELGPCDAVLEQSASFFVALPRLCATVAATRFAPKRASLVLGPVNGPIGEVIVGEGEGYEAVLPAPVTAPHSRLCGSVNITVPRELRDSDVRLLAKYRITEVIIATATKAPQSLNATAWLTNYKEQLSLGASSNTSNKAWSAAFCLPMTEGTLPDMPTEPQTSQAYSMRVSVSWSASDNTTASVSLRRSLRGLLSDSPDVWPYITTRGRDLLYSLFGHVIQEGAPRALQAAGLAGVTLEELQVTSLFLVTVPSPAANSSASSTKKRDWVMPDTASLPGNEAEKGREGGKKISDLAAFGIALGVLVGGAVVGSIIMVVLKTIANMPRPARPHPHYAGRR